MFPFCSSTVVNCLLTSCTDNVCRIWCETIKQADHNDPLSYPSSNHNKCLWHLTEQSKKLQTKGSVSSDPLLKYQLSSLLQFHVAAAVNALSDIPLLSSLDSFSNNNHSSFVLHWLNNKEIQFTMDAESCLGAPILALEVQSIDVSDDSSFSETELFPPSDDDMADSYKGKDYVTLHDQRLVNCTWEIEICIVIYKCLTLSFPTVPSPKLINFPKLQTG